jgi:hypothetical protein
LTPDRIYGFSLRSFLGFADGNFGLSGYGGPSGMGGMGVSGMAPGLGLPPHPSSSQPLPSNVLSKGGAGDRTLDQQYMQQSSQVYVFSTNWANEAASAVMQQQCQSIIAWHESQEETKKTLEVSDSQQSCH